MMYVCVLSSITVHATLLLCGASMLNMLNAHTSAGPREIAAQFMKHVVY